MRGQAASHGSAPPQLFTPKGRSRSSRRTLALGNAECQLITVPYTCWVSGDPPCRYTPTALAYANPLRPTSSWTATRKSFLMLSISTRWVVYQRLCAELSPNSFTSDSARFVFRPKFKLGSANTWPMSPFNWKKSPDWVWILLALPRSSNNSMMRVSMSRRIITAQASYQPCSYEPLSWCVMISRYGRVPWTNDSGSTDCANEILPFSGGNRNSRVSSAILFNSSRPALAVLGLLLIIAKSV